MHRWIPHHAGECPSITRLDGCLLSLVLSNLRIFHREDPVSLHSHWVVRSSDPSKFRFEHPVMHPYPFHLYLGAWRE